jgi:hypothetical protein
MKKWVFIPDRIIAEDDGANGWFVINGAWHFKFIEEPKTLGGPAKLQIQHSPMHHDVLEYPHVFVFEDDDTPSFERGEELMRRLTA